MRDQLAYFDSLTSRLIAEILKENRHLAQYKADVSAYEITDFVRYSALLAMVGLREKKVLLSLSSQLTKVGFARELSMVDHLRMFDNFSQLNLQYPFVGELKEMCVEGVSSYDFMARNNWFLLFRFVCLSELYSPSLNEEDSRKVEECLLKNLGEIKLRSESKNMIEYLTYLPSHSFRELTKEVMMLPTIRFSKRVFYQ